MDNEEGWTEARRKKRGGDADAAPAAPAAALVPSAGPWLGPERPSHSKILFNLRVKRCKLHEQGLCDAGDQGCFNAHTPALLRRCPYLSPDDLGPTAYCGNRCKDMPTCNRGTGCWYTHNDSEYNYHPAHYKTKRCSHSISSSTGFCERNGQYCAFAHSDDDLRLPRHANSHPDGGNNGHAHGGGGGGGGMPTPAGQPSAAAIAAAMRTDGPPVTSQAELGPFIYESYKTYQCTRRGCMCDGWHGRRERRRNPLEYIYCTFPCSKVFTGGSEGNNRKLAWGDVKDCPEGDNCFYAHSAEEQMYHPEKYKTVKCTREATFCQWGLRCSYYHEAERPFDRDGFLERMHRAHEQLSAGSGRRGGPGGRSNGASAPGTPNGDGAAKPAAAAAAAANGGAAAANAGGSARRDRQNRRQLRNNAGNGGDNEQQQQQQGQHHHHHQQQQQASDAGYDAATGPAGNGADAAGTDAQWDDRDNHDDLDAAPKPDQVYASYAPSAPTGTSDLSNLEPPSLADLQSLMRVPPTGGVAIGYDARQLNPFDSDFSFTNPTAPPTPLGPTSTSAAVIASMGVPVDGALLAPQPQLAAAAAASASGGSFEWQSIGASTGAPATARSVAISPWSFGGETGSVPVSAQPGAAPASALDLTPEAMAALYEAAASTAVATLAGAVGGASAAHQALPPGGRGRGRGIPAVGVPGAPATLYAVPQTPASASLNDILENFADGMQTGLPTLVGMGRGGGPAAPPGPAAVSPPLAATTTTIVIDGLVVPLPPTGAPDESRQLREIVHALNKRRLKMESMVQCPICMDRERNTAFFPCGHVTCNACARLLQQRPTTLDGEDTMRGLCPQCRQAYSSMLHVFL